MKKVLSGHRNLTAPLIAAFSKYFLSTYDVPNLVLGPNEGIELTQFSYRIMLISTYRLNAVGDSRQLCSLCYGIDLGSLE